jgi:hypothetical protein
MFEGLGGVQPIQVRNFARGFVDDFHGRKLNLVGRIQGQALVGMLNRLA